MIYLHERIIVKQLSDSGTSVGAMIVTIGSHVLLWGPFNNIRTTLRNESRSTIILA